MSKKCVKCGQLLPDNASFCPHCTAIQNEKKEVKAPRRWKKKALTAAAAVILLAVSGLAVSFYHRPQIYEGGAQIEYQDDGKSYNVLLCFSAYDGVTGHAMGENVSTIAEGTESAVPCQLYVLDSETGELAGAEFADKVESCTVDTKAAENSLKMEFVEPTYNVDFPNAVYVADIVYTSDSGTNDILWTLNMKNGDTLSMSTRITVEKLAAVTYSAEDVPMETAEELQALLDEIDEEVSSEVPVFLYLPAVTYEGDIHFGDHIFNIYGSVDGDAVTTFTGTVSMNGQNGNYAEISGINFQGQSGIGLDAYCLVLLEECSFDGWDIGAIAQDEAWVHAMDCTFTNNEMALKFNNHSFYYGSSPDYLDNIFTGNGTAICIDALPGDEVIDFAGSIFSDNDTDIENNADHPVNTVNAIFE